MGTSNVSVKSNLNKIDAVIVLANYMDCCGVLNDESKARAVSDDVSQLYGLLWGA
jgi:hypothetical protein